MRGFIVIVGILVAIGLFVYCGVGNWLLNRDTTAVLERAQVAANAEDMLGYVVQLENNMVEHRMTEGHAAVIFRTPANDMELIFKTVTRIKERLEIVELLPQSDTTYQVALDDLRGTLRELDVCAGGWFWATRGWWMMLISIFGLIVAIFKA